jgi:hypothetical protein
MTYEEFCELVPNCKPIDRSEYSNIVEVVYSFHPLIDDVGGKLQIAKFYNLGGMRLMRDMLPTAIKARDIQNKIDNTKSEISRLKDNLSGYEKDMESLKRGEDEY